MVVLMYLRICFIQGGPGSGKGTQCKMIVDRYKTFVHLSMGDILRTEIATKGTADKKWGLVSSLVQKGEMAPQVLHNYVIGHYVKVTESNFVWFVY